MGRGRGKRGRTQRRDFKEGRENVWKKPKVPEERPQEGGDATGYAPFVLGNPAFEAYYKKQGVVPEEEWEQFNAVLLKPLPTTFRINGGGQFAECIRDQMRRDFFDYLKDETTIDGEVVEPARPLPWYPKDLAWHLSFSRSQLRKIPILQRIHEFLKEENELGNITRQEAVSMVPPLFLDVQPHHYVLDMCAAPGSKTFQLLEAIHSQDEPGNLSKGMVIANDMEVQRCHLLIHQTKRMCSPNILVTNHEAQHFPGLKKRRTEGWQPPAPNADEPAESKRELGENVGVMFDRVLCDVPCSGDGTLRKAPDLWKRWSTGMGNGLHCLQAQIAMRGVALLKVGGRMVYSTCSLNPIEDEAVVAEILRQSDGSMELLDVSSELPELKRRPGLKSWKVRGKRTWLSSYQEGKYRQGSILPSMFPSGRRMEQIRSDASEGSEKKVDADAMDVEEEAAEGSEEGEAEVSAFPLDRCMRILPHDQDTGGFFIAVFQKVLPFKCVPKSKPERKNNNTSSKVESFASKSDTPSEVCETETPEVAEDAGGVEKAKSTAGIKSDTISEVCETEIPEVAEDAGGVEKAESADGKDESKQPQGGPDKAKKQRQGPWHGVDPVLFLEDEQIISSLISYYGIRETLPLRGHLIVRSEDTSRVKRIYYVSKSVSDVARLNLQTGQMLKITSAGLKIFERHSNKDNAAGCLFRIASEGLPLLLPHLTKQLLHASKEDFKLLLSPNPVNFTAFQDETFISAIQNLLVGCCVVVLKDDTAGTGDVVAIGCWRGRTNMSLLIPRVEADQILKRLYPGGDQVAAVQENIEDAAGEDKADETKAVEDETESVEGGETNEE